MKNLLFFLLMIMSSTAYSWNGQSLNDSVYHVPAANLRAANAIYYHQQRQLSVRDKIIHHRGLQVENMTGAYNQCVVSRDISQRINLRDEMIIKEKDGIIHQQDIIIKGMGVALAASFTYIIYKQVRN